MMDRKSAKPYIERKEELRRVFYKITEHPEYRNRTYKGRSFREGLLEFEDAWFALIYHSSDFNTNKEWEDRYSFEYKLCKWSYWDHNFNHALFRMYSESEKQGVDVPFMYPEFIDGLFEITYKFLNARTREEESEALNYTYKIDFVKRILHEDGTQHESIYKVIKYLWLTEENVDTKSKYLPNYFKTEYRDIFKRRTKKYYNDYKNTLAKWLDDEVKDEIVEEEKECTRVVRLAVKKGLIKNIKESKEKRK